MPSRSPTLASSPQDALRDWLQATPDHARLCRESWWHALYHAAADRAARGVGAAQCECILAAHALHEHHLGRESLRWPVGSRRPRDPEAQIVRWAVRWLAGVADLPGLGRCASPLPRTDIVAVMVGWTRAAVCNTRSWGCASDPEGVREILREVDFPDTPVNGSARIAHAIQGLWAGEKPCFIPSSAKSETAGRSR